MNKSINANIIDRIAAALIVAAAAAAAAERAKSWRGLCRKVVTEKGLSRITGALCWELLLYTRERSDSRMRLALESRTAVAPMIAWRQPAMYDCRAESRRVSLYNQSEIHNRVINARSLVTTAHYQMSDETRTFCRINARSITIIERGYFRYLYDYVIS